MIIYRPNNSLEWGTFSYKPLKDVFNIYPHYIEWIVLNIPKFFIDPHDFDSSYESLFNEKPNESEFDLDMFYKIHQENSKRLWDSFLHKDAYRIRAKFSDWLLPFLKWKQQKQSSYLTQEATFISYHAKKFGFYKSSTKLGYGKNEGATVGGLIYSLPNYIEWEIVNNPRFVLDPELFITHVVSPYNGNVCFKRTITNLIGEHSIYNEDYSDYIHFEEMYAYDEAPKIREVHFSFLNDIKELNAYKYYLRQQEIDQLKARETDEYLRSQNDYLDAFEGDPSNVWNVD